MTASKRWALVIGLVSCVVALAGGTAWMRYAAQTATTSPQQVTSATVPPPAPPAPSPVPAAPLPPSEPPRFDIVRVEPSGDTVVAGKGEANAKVALLSEGAVIAEATADGNGHFVILPPALTPGDHSLSLRQTPPKSGPSTSAQSVTVVVPERGKGSVVVALAEPGQATKVLSAPAPEPQPAPPSMAAAPASPPAPTPTVPGDPNAKVAVSAVDLEHGDGFHASGVAAPGTPLSLYLNDTHIADVVAGKDGQWTVTIKKGLSGGHYVVRADAGAPRTAATAPAKVTGRAEVPFDVPVTAQTTSVTPPDARQPRTGTLASAADAVVDEIQTARVVNGDNLWNISLSRLGQATRYTQIYAANEKQIRDPNLIYPGQVFVLPK